MDLLQILFFSGLAVFLAIRLYLALGKNTGRTHEDHVREERERATAAAPGTVRRGPATVSDGAAPTGSALSSPVAEGLAAIGQADRSFDADMFAAGARQAYQMIVSAFARGDRDTLRTLLTDRVMAAYETSISDREASGQTVRTEIERIKRAEIVEALFNDTRAKVRVAFSAELASETRDAEGAVVQGDLTTLKTVDEIWSFERDVTSADPNWKLASVKPA